MEEPEFQVHRIFAEFTCPKTQEQKFSDIYMVMDSTGDMHFQSFVRKQSDRACQLFNKAFDRGYERGRCKLMLEEEADDD